jgi:hypothetical protein
MNKEEADKIIKNDTDWSDVEASAAVPRAFGFLEGREAGIREAAEKCSKLLDRDLKLHWIVKGILDLLKEKP